MKLTNFKISEDNIGLQLDNEEYIDLHNNYDLINFNYRFENRVFEVSWKKSIGNWVRKDSPNNLTLVFSNVSILRIRELDQTLESLNEFPEDDKSLSIIGFTDKEDKEFLGYIPNPNLEAENLALTLQTENGQAIIVFCKNVEAIIR